MIKGKTIALTRRTFVGKVMSLLLNMLSRLVISFLPRSKHLLISWLQSPSAVMLEPKKIKSDTEVIDISPSNLDSSLCFFQPSVSHDALCISEINRVTIYSLDVRLFLFGTSLLFQVQF